MCLTWRIFTYEWGWCPLVACFDLAKEENLWEEIVVSLIKWCQWKFNIWLWYVWSNVVSVQMMYIYRWPPHRTGLGWQVSLHKERRTSDCNRFEQSITRIDCWSKSRFQQLITRIMNVIFVNKIKSKQFTICTIFSDHHNHPRHQYHHQHTIFLSSALLSAQYFLIISITSKMKTFQSRELSCAGSRLLCVVRQHPPVRWCWSWRSCWW